MLQNIYINEPVNLQVSHTYVFDLCERRENNLEHSHTRGTKEASSLELNEPEVF